MCFGVGMCLGAVKWVGAGMGGTCFMESVL